MDSTDEMDSIIEFYGAELVGKFFNSFPETILLPLEERVKRFRNSINPQTQFFRDPVVLDTFENIVLPNYPPNQVVHVASVGCSYGKEPYSLLLKNWYQRERLKIDAFDVNPKRIKTAIVGEYNGIEERDLKCLKELNLVNPNEAYSLTYGIESVEEIKFSEEMKREVNFQVHDILKEALPQRYDVVLLLNMLMHYKPKGRERILSNVYESMKDNGWLLCEATNWDDHSYDRKEYFKWMENIERLGFETVPQPPQMISSESRTAKTYRKHTEKKGH